VDIIRSISLDMFEGGLNDFYCYLENELRRGLRSGARVEYEKLLEIRLLPPILSLILYRGEHAGSSEWRIVRCAALYAVLKHYGELSPEVEDFFYDKLGLNSDLAGEAYSKLGEVLEGGLSGEHFICFQVFEVGGKQVFIRRTGGFMDMRGASAMIDIATKIAGDIVSELLGREFLIVDEAGETVFLSSPRFAVDVEDKILEELLHRCSLLDVLAFRGNGRRGVNVSPSDLFNHLGDVYLLALLSVKDLDIGGEREEIEPSKLCRSCRQEKTLEEGEIERLIMGFVNPKYFKEVYNSIVREIGPYLCKTCLASRLFGKALSDVLNGKDYYYRKDFVECIVKSSVFDVLKEAEKMGIYERMKFILSLDDYNYDMGNAIIALVSGDGDSFGFLKSRAKSLKDFYFLSLFFSEIMRSGILEGIRGILRVEEDIQGVKEALTDRRGSEFYFPLTPLYHAGDDFLLVIRGEYIPKFVESFYRGSYRIYRNASTLLKKLLIKRFGVSMGVVAGRTKLPGLFLYDASMEALKYTKNVTKGFYGSELGKEVEFSVQAGLVYVKSRLSWSLMSKVCHIPDKGKSVYFVQFYNTFLYLSDRSISPIYRSLKTALGFVRADDLKEIMEDFLPESGIHPYMSFIKLVNDIARGLEREGEERGKASALQYIVESFLRSHERDGEGRVLAINNQSWKWLYTLSSLLDIIEDRGRGEVGGENIEKYFEKVRGEIVGKV